MATMTMAELAGTDLGGRAVRYNERDAILFALAVGAPGDALDQVYERDLRVQPSFACTLGLWAVEAAGDLGAYDRIGSLHAAQTLRIHTPLPPAASLPTRGRVIAAWDKGKAALVEIEVTCDWFTAGYTIFLPGRGGWGGERGPTAPARSEEKPPAGASATAAGGWAGRFATWPAQAALYRLTGDRHPVHIDPEVARGYGLERPILHGLCTLGIAAREIASSCGAHPADLRALQARLSAPVTPGDTILINARVSGEKIEFEASSGSIALLRDGRAEFKHPG